MLGEMQRLRVQPVVADGHELRARRLWLRSAIRPAQTPVRERDVSDVSMERRSADALTARMTVARSAMRSRRDRRVTDTPDHGICVHRSRFSKGNVPT